MLRCDDPLRIRLITVFPLPERVVQEFAMELERIVVPEMNLGQTCHSVREAVEGRARVELVGRIGGEIIPPRQVTCSTTPCVRSTASGSTSTRPYGNLEEPFDLCRLAIGAGAPVVARWTVGYPYETVASIEAAIRKKGFSFVELLMPCPTGFGKENELRDPRKIWKWYREHAISRADLAKLSPEERAANRRIVIGTLWESEKPEFTARWGEFVKGLGE